jgi:DNA-binding transcriptional regulator YdaS (Cro superfamily)
MEHPLDRAMRRKEVSATVLAAHLGVTRAAVAQWKQPGRVVPAEHCPKIERFFEGDVRCEELNDRVDWNYLRQSAENPGHAPELSSAAPQEEGV